MTLDPYNPLHHHNVPSLQYLINNEGDKTIGAIQFENVMSESRDMLDSGLNPEDAINIQVESIY